MEIAVYVSVSGEKQSVASKHTFFEISFVNGIMNVINMMAS
jgi:hypothetical protein